jgi:hypothetical protein
MTEEARMTAVITFFIGALAGAGTVYAFYRRLQGELTRLKEAARTKVDSML